MCDGEILDVNQGGGGCSSLAGEIDVNGGNASGAGGLDSGNLQAAGSRVKTAFPLTNGI